MKEIENDVAVDIRKQYQIEQAEAYVKRNESDGSSEDTEAVAIIFNLLKWIKADLG